MARRKKKSKGSLFLIVALLVAVGGGYVAFDKLGLSGGHVAKEAGVGPQALLVADLKSGEASAEVIDRAKGELEERLTSGDAAEGEGASAAAAPQDCASQGALACLQQASAAMIENARVIKAINVTLGDYRAKALRNQGSLEDALRCFQATEVLLEQAEKLLGQYLTTNKGIFRKGLSGSIGQTDDQIQQVIEQADKLPDGPDKAKNTADLVKSIAYLRSVKKAADDGIVQLKAQWMWADAQRGRFQQRRAVLQTKIETLEASKLTLEVIRANAVAFDAIQFDQPPRLDLPKPAELQGAAPAATN